MNSHDELKYGWSYDDLIYDDHMMNSHVLGILFELYFYSIFVIYFIFCITYLTFGNHKLLVE